MPSPSYRGQDNMSWNHTTTQCHYHNVVLCRTHINPSVAIGSQAVSFMMMRRHRSIPPYWSTAGETKLHPLLKKKIVVLFQTIRPWQAYQVQQGMCEALYQVCNC